MTTTIRQLTPANVRVLTEYQSHLPPSTIGKTVISIEGSAETVLYAVTDLKLKIHSTKGGRSFENRAIVAVLNKLRDYQSGGRYAKHVKES